jgi:ornithine racemase
MPKLLIYQRKIKKNIEVILSLCKIHDLQLFGVLKSCQMLDPILQLFIDSGIKTIGFSDIEIAGKSKLGANGSALLLTMPKPNQADMAVQHFGGSVNSELITIRALSEAADRLRTTHEIMLMVEMGDLREGILPENVLNTVQSILDFKSPYLKIRGLGGNMACLCDKFPNSENLFILDNLANDIEKYIGYKFDKISIGGSILLDWLGNKIIPHKINELRIGEAILLGTIPVANRRHESLINDAFIFEGSILEIKDKKTKFHTNSNPLDRHNSEPGKIETRRRAIVNFGKINTVPESLFSLEKNIHYIGSTSNYTVFDVTDCSRKLVPGDELRFIPNYTAMIQSLISPYVSREIVFD